MLGTGSEAVVVCGCSRTLTRGRPVWEAAWNGVLVGLWPSVRMAVRWGWEVRVASMRSEEEEPAVGGIVVAIEAERLRGGRRMFLGLCCRVVEEDPTAGGSLVGGVELGGGGVRAEAEGWSIRMASSPSRRARYSATHCVFAVGEPVM